MPDIEYVRQHGLPLAQAKQMAQQTADDLAKEYDLASEWRLDTLHFHRSGVKGQMDVDPVRIALEVELSFPLSLMKEKFETNIRKYVDERLSQAKAAIPKTAAAKKTKPAGKKTTRKA